MHCNTRSTINSSRRAPSCIHGRCILHRSAFIHDPGLSRRTPPLQDPGVARIGLDFTVLDCMAALLSYWLLSPYGISSRPVWPGLSTDLQSPRALRPMSCRANPSWSCHHHKRHGPICGRAGRGGEQPPHQEPPAGSTCGPVRYWIWHMDGRLCVPQQKRPGLLAALQLSVDIAPTRYPQYP